MNFELRILNNLSNSKFKTYNSKLLLARFRVFGVCAATRTKLLETQAFFDVFLVLRRLVVALFAIAARQRQIGLILIRHLNPDPQCALLRARARNFDTASGGNRTRDLILTKEALYH